MKNLRYSIALVLSLFFGTLSSQEFKTALNEFKVDENATISIEASYAEIEIEEWNKNKVEVQGIMSIQGMSKEEAKGIFDTWQIETESTGKKVSIRANSNAFGDEYFFIHNDKFIGNVIVDVPEISAQVLEALDSIHFVLPEIAEFPDIDYDFHFDFDMDYEALNFDYEAFKEDSEYLKEWQERNREQFERLKKELKEKKPELAEQQKQLKKEIIIIQKQAMEEAAREIEVHAREIEEHSREIEEQAREMEAEMRERESEIQRIIEKRQEIKIKRIIKIKVPKNAKLEMDVDYCKISTLK